MFDQITTLVEMLNLLSLDHRLILREGDEPLFHLRQLREAGEAGNTDELLSAMSTLTPNELYRVFAALQLKPEALTRDQISGLHEILVDDKSVALKTAVARQLRLSRETSTIDRLFDVLIRCPDPQLRSTIAYAIAENPSATWQGKVDQMIKVLQRYRYHRENLDAATLVTAISPSLEQLAQSRFLLTDHLIHKAVLLTDDLERMTGILAGLIIESVGHNLNRANQRVGEYEYAHAEPATALVLLRSEMNSLLTPAERQAQLEGTFSGPLREAHDEIRHIWESSIKDVDRYLRARQRLGAIGFGLGLLTLLVAVVMIIFVQNSNGLVVALMGIITLAGTAVYAGSVRDNKEILTEIGAANTVYAAYIQRILQINNTYTHYYLQDKLTYTELQESNKLISEAMNDAIKALRATGQASFEDLIAQLK